MGLICNTSVDQLTRSYDELRHHFRNRFSAIQITSEDIEQLTDNTKIVYTIDDDPKAVPPLADRRLVGRTKP